MSGSFGELVTGAADATRRAFLRRAGGGFGAIAAAWLLERDSSQAGVPVDPMAPRPPHFPAKATRVIYLFMHGGPSHVDLIRKN